MKTKLVKRHHCDYCSKGFFKKPSCVRHESVCFRNPARSCFLFDNPSPAIKEHIAEFQKNGLDGLRTLVGNCPGCIMSVILQTRPRRHVDPEDWVDFEYKKERDKWGMPEPGMEMF